VVPLERLAELAGRPATDVTILDQRAVELAFVEGALVDHTLRILSTNRTVRFATTIDGVLVDLDSLRTTSRERVQRYSAKMDRGLQQVVERHPEIEQLRVRLHTEHATTTHVGVPASQVMKWLVDPAVHFIELEGEPDILDD
jgi:hypothetical protein